MRRENFGFTLAETLITLGIIGVIAAITLPPIIANYQKKRVETQLKSTVSIISEVIKFAELDYGEGFEPVYNSIYVDEDINGFSWQKGNDFYVKYLKPYTKVIKEYPKEDAKYFRRYGINGGDSTYSKLPTYFVLSNGVCLGLTVRYRGEIIVSLWLKPGKKMFDGKDDFSFMLTNQGGRYHIDSYVSQYYNQDNRENFKNWCVSKNTHPVYATSRSDFCTYLLMINNWEFPDDYPIKF